jgi:uncharacterized SAM-dependent methyltransferase
LSQGLFARLEKSLSDGWGRWSLNLEGQDPRTVVKDLVTALRGDPPDFSGKRIPNRHRYVGLGPTLAWVSVSTDWTYPITYESREAFARLWDACMPAMSGTKYHYVSLGIGSGEKDRHVLDRLMTTEDADQFYVPVDISGQMLRLGAAEAQRRMPGRVLPIEMDFEDPAAIGSLRELLDHLLGAEPAVIGLLGSSLANIDDEAGFLCQLTGLLRPHDRLALEVATTRHLDATSAKAAAEERSVSRLYNEFVTAALAMHTDLTIDTNWLRFDGSIEAQRAIRVDGYYVNCSQETIMMTLPNKTTVPFRPNETIQVLLGRKYHPDGLRQLLSSCQLREVAFEEDFNPMMVQDDSSGARFGLAIMILEHEPKAALPQTPLGRVWETPVLPASRRA